MASQDDSLEKPLGYLRKVLLQQQDRIPSSLPRVIHTDVRSMNLVTEWSTPCLSGPQKGN
jgi:hypothetical protein